MTVFEIMNSIEFKTWCNSLNVWDLVDCGIKKDTKGKPISIYYGDHEFVIADHF